MRPFPALFSPLLLLVPCLLLAQPAPEKPPPAFEPTRAQQNEPRVRRARELRSDDIRALFAGKGLDYPPAQVLLRVLKNDDQLEMWARPNGKQEYLLLKSYAICARSGDLGPKRRQGDMQVPEGFYQVTNFHPESEFHLAMLISYPNESDRLRAQAKDPGGAILIHGACCTIGCIPLTDRWIEELYLICLDTWTRRGTRVLVQIFPARLDDQGLAALREKYSDYPELLAFWEELRPGFEAFERTHQPAKLTVDKKGIYRFAPSVPAPATTTR